MAIILPFPLTVQEMRVLQEYRRISAETLPLDTLRAVKHPAGGGEAPVKSLVSKGYLAEGEGGFTLTPQAKEFLSIDYKPEVEGGGDEAAE
jgi:hypothetical protein